MVFPNYTRVGGGSGLRHELQIRVPIDDTHTYHVDVRHLRRPRGTHRTPPGGIPYYEVPIADEHGEPILDFVLGQDMVMWASQGPIADRSREELGGTDEAVRRFRDLLEEQITLVEAGGEPMNVFRPGRYGGEMLELEPRIGAALDRQVLEINKSGAFRDRYHEGYYRDDHDRYGPVLAEMIELMRRADELAMARPYADPRTVHPFHRYHLNHGRNRPRLGGGVPRGDVRPGGGGRPRHPGPPRRAPRLLATGGLGDGPPPDRRRLPGPRRARRLLHRAGQVQATSIVRRHRLAERFLVDIVGLPWHKAHTEAGRWEHVISPDVEARFIELLGNPATCPHGSPIPGGPVVTTPQIPMAEAAPGTHIHLARITEQIETDPDALVYLSEHGIIPGRDAVISERAPDGTVMLTVDEGAKTVAVGAAMSRQIYVNN